MDYYLDDMMVDRTYEKTIKMLMMAKERMDVMNKYV
jgi:hypothetical protein